MKFQDEVSIVTDSRNFEDANALRIVLESFGLRTHFFRLFQRRQALALFSKDALPAPWTILMAHGFSTDEGCGVRYEVVDNPSEDPRAVEGWYKTNLDLTPALIPEVIKNADGFLVTNACGGGDARLAGAFLDVGFDAYIANPERHVDFASGMLFLFGLFYFLIVGEHEYAPSFAVEEAVQRAKGLHGDWKHGTAAFRLFTKENAAHDESTA